MKQRGGRSSKKNNLAFSRERVSAKKRDAEQENTGGGKKQVNELKSGSFAE